jgi:23S rRNA pseudouridine2605 synthase
MRLNKFISHYTKYSRREADKLIEEGEVKLNHQILQDYSYDVKKADKIYIKNRLIKVSHEITVIVYNKPKGVLVTKKDDRGRATIYHKLSGKFRHFIPIGRLDYASEGVLLLTNSPKVADKLMHSKLNRTYNIKIDKPVSKDMIEAMQEGLNLDDASAGAHEQSDITQMVFAPFVHYEIRNSGTNFSKLRVTINEGKNRELRRFFAHFGATVLDLKRIEFGGITLNNLPTNKTRYFSRREYEDLHLFMDETSQQKQKRKSAPKKENHKEESLDEFKKDLDKAFRQFK